MLPEGLSGIAQPGDHVARKLLSEGFWHHGIFAGQNPDSTLLGDFLVIDSSPYDDATASVQLCSLKDFLGEDPVEAAAIVRYDGDEEQGRNMALRRARQILLNPKPERWNLMANNCESFATLCWTGRCDAFTIISQMLPQSPKRPRHRRRKLIHCPPSAGGHQNRWIGHSKPLV